MRFVYLVIALLYTLALSAQQPVATPLARGDRFYSYVLCNGKKVDAIYSVRKRSIKEVALGCNKYSVTAIDTCLSGKIEVPASVTAPNGQTFLVTSVSRHAFANCRHIMEIILPDSVNDIGDQSFMNCRSLRSIILPVGTRNLWPYAFRGCISLRCIKVKALVPPDSYNDVFDDHALRFATLVVPAASAEAYSKAFVWNMFRYSIADFDL